MTTPDFDAVDFFRAGALYQNPYPYYEYLFAHGPVWREPHHGVVMVTGYEEALSVYHDTENWSNCNVVSGPFARWPVPLEGDDISPIIEAHRDDLPFFDQLPSFDPPKHTDHRALLGRLITPKRLKENEAFMWRLADRQLDTFIDRGACEFIDDYTQPFTFFVVADLLGVPEDQHAQFRKEMQGEDSPVETGLKTGKGVAHSPLEFLYERFTAFIEDRRAHPQDDVLTALATATFPDGSLPEVRDVMLISTNLFAAGGETTARVLGVMFRMLGERPDLQDELRKDRSKLPNFIEECLRLETPLQSSFRLSRRAARVGDLEVPPGTTVMLLPAAANRDPRRYEAPNEFRMNRPNWRQHLAFGSGVHACAGAPLARAEARVTAERLLDRMRNIRVSEEHHGQEGDRRYAYPETYMLRGLNELHLTFSKAD